MQHGPWTSIRMRFSQPPPSVTSAETPHPPVPLPNGQFAEVGEVLRAPFGQDPLWIHQPATNPFNMGTAEQGITLLHLRLLFFNKTSCSEIVILEVSRIVNRCESFLKMPWGFSDLQDLERQAFDLRSSMQPDLVFSGSCHEGSFMLCTTPRRPHLGMANILHPVVIWGQACKRSTRLYWQIAWIWIFSLKLQLRVPV